MIFSSLMDQSTWRTIPISETETIHKISVTDENVGKTATIDGEEYIVLYGAGEQGQNVQLISSNVYEPESVNLGFDDNIVDWTDSNIISVANIFEDTESRTRCIIRC